MRKRGDMMLEKVDYLEIRLTIGSSNFQNNNIEKGARNRKL